jgi:hypothetical protein
METSFLDSPEFKQMELLQQEKLKSVKAGPNVIHIDYYQGVLEQDDLTYISNLLAKNNLEFSSYNKSGTLYAHFDAFSLSMFITIAQPILIQFLDDVYPNATWDCIKLIASGIAKKVSKRQKLYEYNGKKMKKKKIKYGLKIVTPTGTHVEFELNGHMSEKTISKALDRTLGIISNISKQKPKYGKFNFINGKWKLYDVESERYKYMKRNSKKGKKKI